MSGHPLLGDGWWVDAEKTQLLLPEFRLIENHSWGHNHPNCGITSKKNGNTGSFDVIDNYSECDQEVRMASEFIQQLTGKTKIYYLPIREVNISEYIAKAYCPDFQHKHK